tara:strand:+ start:9438 stop:9737 length:300 start_codon:yes stop_codon:yes gene_type:complete
MAFTALVIAVFTYIKVEREARESNSGYNEDYQRIHDRLSRNYVEQAEAIANLQYDLSKYKKDSPRLSETYKSVKKRKTNKVNSSKVSNKKPNNKKQIAK